MSDKTDTFRAILIKMGKDDNIRRTIQEGNIPAMMQLLKVYGFEDTPTIEDFNDLRKLASTYKTDAQIASENQNAENRAAFEKDKAKQDYTSAVERIMQLDPKTKLLYTALTAAGEGAHAIGNISRNNGNRLAQAILEGNRDHSAEQDRIYGPSIKDKANAMEAAETMRRGENAGAIWDAIGNAVQKALGMDQQNDLTVRQMKMIPYDKDMNMSGNYYQMMNQDRKRAFNVGR